MTSDSTNERRGAHDLKDIAAHLSDQLKAWRDWAEKRTGQRGVGTGDQELRDSLDRAIAGLVGREEPPEFPGPED